MYNNLEERIIAEALFTIDHNATVRATAKAFSLSKSTIHKDLSVKLYYIDPRLYIEVKKVLGVNLSSRHIRGGMATKEKYLRLKNYAENKYPLA